DHHHVARSEFVDEVTHRARFFRIQRSVQDGVGATGEAKILVTGLDAEALARDTQLVQRIAQRGSVQPGHPFYVLVCHCVIAVCCYVSVGMPPCRIRAGLVRTSSRAWSRAWFPSPRIPASRRAHPASSAVPARRASRPLEALLRSCP